MTETWPGDVALVVVAPRGETILPPQRVVKPSGLSKVDPICTKPGSLRQPVYLLYWHPIKPLQTGPQPIRGQTTLLDDLLAVIPEEEPRVWGEVAAQRLARYRPATYSGWSTEQLPTALRPYRVSTVQIAGIAERAPRQRRGIVRSDLVRISNESGQRDRPPTCVEEDN